MNRLGERGEICTYDAWSSQIGSRFFAHIINFHFDHILYTHFIYFMAFFPMWCGKVHYSSFWREKIPNCFLYLFWMAETWTANRFVPLWDSMTYLIRHFINCHGSMENMTNDVCKDEYMIWRLLVEKSRTIWILSKCIRPIWW